MSQSSGEGLRVQGAAGAVETETDASVCAPEGECGPGAEVARAQAEAEARRQAERDEAEQACDVLRKAAVKAFRQAEGAYRKGLLETGRLCQEYVLRRMGPPIAARREAAVQALEGQLAQYASSEVDVNELVRCWAAWHLLCEAQGLKSDVPYGHYVHAWSQLVERLEKDTPQERWALLPGLEAECLAAFAEAVKHGVDREAARDRVRPLVAEYARREKAAKEALRKEAAEREAGARQQAEAALADVGRRAEQVAEIVRQKEQAAGPEEQKALEERLGAERQALLGGQQKARALEEQRRRAVKDRQKKDREAREAGQRADREQRKLEGQAPAPRRRAGACRQENTLPRPGACGTVKDTVEMVVGFIVKHDEQDDVALGVARALARHVELAKLTQRAFANAAEIIERGTAPAKAG
jgi:hypothetical protein